MIYIDNIDFAKNRQTTNASVDVSKLKRATELFENLTGNLEYTITGDIDGKNKPILKVTICGKITTLCQNCLENMEIAIEHSGLLHIFYNESDLDLALFGDDSEYEDGILADTHFDIQNFIEDELIMLLPMAPKHEQCINMSYHDKPESPFKVLVN